MNRPTLTASDLRNGPEVYPSMLDPAHTRRFYSDPEDPSVCYADLAWAVHARRLARFHAVRNALREATNLPLHWIPLTDTSLSRDMARLAIVADTWQRAS